MPMRPVAQGQRMMCWSAIACGYRPALPLADVRPRHR
jgi:hypothetical protein